MLPENYLSRLRKILGDGISAYLAAFEEQPVRALRINAGKCDPDAVSRYLADVTEPCPVSDLARYYTGDAGIGRHPLHHAGAVYMQEPSAMLPVLTAGLKQGMRVLDTCAAPGGKSGEAAALVGDTGLLLSNEIDTRRAVILAGNLERLGIPNAVVTNTDTETLAATYPAFFDAVIVDAPCSGEGMFRKDEGAITDWSEENVRACARRQREILDQAEKTLIPGGVLVYSTCTFSPEEDEEVLYGFLCDHPYFSIEPVPQSVAALTVPGIDTGHGDLSRRIAACARRFYPHTGRGEGQFMARLVKGKDAPVSQKPREKGRREATVTPMPDADRAVFRDFIEKTLVKGTVVPEPVLFKGSVSLLPFDIPTPERITYARGVRAGTVIKGRFEPDHAFFSAYGRYFIRKRDFAPDDPLLARYLHGEEIPLDLPDGYAVICVAGCPVGGVKVSLGTAKNRYPKGLRNP